MKNLIQISQQLIAIFLIVLTTAAHAHDAIDDKQSIRNTINNTYDTPQHKVVIEPIVIQGEFAVASWIQQDKGGRVVLFRNAQEKWDIVLCSGEAVKEVEFLVQIGIPQSDADELTKALVAAEENLDAEKIALFDSFKGVVRGSHDSVHETGHSPNHPTKVHSHH